MTPVLSKVATCGSNTAGRREITVGLLHWPPISSAGRLQSLLPSGRWRRSLEEDGESSGAVDGAPGTADAARSARLPWAARHTTRNYLLFECARANAHGSRHTFRHATVPGHCPDDCPLIPSGCSCGFHFGADCAHEPHHRQVTSIECDQRRRRLQG